MITKTLFAALDNGREIWKYQIQNASGASVSLLNLGAAIQQVVVPDRYGNLENVTLGYDHAEAYLQTKTYAGAICGRVANRIGGAVFYLNGREYKLQANDGNNHLHGGPGGFHQKLWAGEIIENGVRFTLISPDGDEGYPGNLTVRVSYSWSEDNSLSISYEAVSDRDTLCNLTNHAYWNLGGYQTGDALSQRIQIFSDFCTPIDERVLPTGEIAPVTGALDLREPKLISAGKKAQDSQIRLVNGYDHNFVLRGYTPGKLITAACLWDEASGRRLRINTTMPGLQFFSGSQQPEGHTGVALETQCFPNASQYWWFPTVVLPAGVTQTSRTVYRFDNF